MADWQKIKTEYITTQTSYRKLAEKHGVSYQTICHRSKAEGWTAQRERHMNKTVTKAISKVGERQVARAVRLQEVADKLLCKIEACVDAIEPERVDTQSFKHISGAMKDLKEIQMVRSDADLAEQEARIAKLRKDTEGPKEDGDKQIIVTIGGGEDTWSK